MNLLWHFGNAILCTIVGGFLLGLLPNIIVDSKAGISDLFIFIFAYIPFFVASVRSGKKTITLLRHLANSFVGCFFAFLLTRTPYIEGNNYIVWLVCIGIGSLTFTSLISGRKRTE